MMEVPGVEQRHPQGPVETGALLMHATGRNPMNVNMSRWKISLGWAVLMMIVWTVFVPTSISVLAFVLLGLTGLVVSSFGSTFLADSESPRSIDAILNQLEAEPKTGALKTRRP
jgi:hypothetical protein